MDIIYDLTGYISELDITLAIVRLSLNPDYCRPTFGPDLRLIQAVHPFLQYASHNTHPPPVPNNVVIALFFVSNVILFAYFYVCIRTRKIDGL